jgi:mono/diheme cytochrome c family protein
MPVRVGVAVVVGLLAGCGGVEPDGYPVELRYPLRTDPVVVRPPAEQPTGYPPPGTLDASISASAERGGELAVALDPSDDESARVAAELDRLFGTPADPRLADRSTLGEFDVSPGTLAVGSRVYAQRCVTCHGLTGDGRGPLGPWTAPYPRDFRAGAFKVAVGSAKPSRDALVGLLKRGVPGSAMPLYDLLPEDELKAVASYVIHLSVRGEAEAAAVRAAVDADDPVTTIGRATATASEAWAEPPSVVVVAGVDAASASYPASARRGRELFHSPAVGCSSCHEDYGRSEAYRYDRWGVPVRVSDLTRGEWKWGRDDATLATRIRYGIPASGMPANPSLNDDQLRDLTTFVRDLSAPGRLPADVRVAVYPPQAVAR